jgi:outer membrane protein assembly factor BamB
MGMRKILLFFIFYFKFSESNDDYEDYDDQCSSGDEAGVAPWVDDEILIMQTMDGKVHAVEKLTGNTKWSAVLDKNWFPLTNEDVDGQKFPESFSFLPDPSDGSIYTYVGGRLSKLPLTIPQMVERSPTRSPGDNTVYIGDKKDNFFIIDKQSGNVKRKITPAGSKKGENEPESRLDDIYIGYTDYTLTMFDDKTNEVKWNLTYSELKDIGSANSGRDNLQLDIDVSTSTGDVIIHGFEGLSRQFRSRCNLGFPVIGVFSSTQLGLKRHQFKTYSPDHFSSGTKIRKNNEMKSLVYIGLHFNHPYAVCSYSDSSKIYIPDESPNESSDRITHNHRTKWDMIGYHEVTETQSSTGNLLGPSSDESDSCWASDPTGQSCNIPPTKSTVIQIENENTQGNRVLLNTQQSNITQGTRDTNIHNIY